MKTGVWIDAEKAWIIKMKESDERFVQLDSNLDSDLLKSLNDIESSRYGTEDVPNDMELRKRLRPLNVFFDKVVEMVKDSESILLEGSAEVKLALLERLHDSGIGTHQKVVCRECEKVSFLEFRERIKDYYI